MLDNDTTPSTEEAPAPATKPRRRRAASRPAGPPEPVAEVTPEAAVTEGTPEETPEEAPAVPEPLPDAEVPPRPEEEVADATTEVAPDPTQDAPDAPARQVLTPFAAPAAERRPRRRATAAAGPPAADIFTTPAAAPGAATAPAPPVADPAPEAGDEEAPARPVRARRGRRRPAADTTGEETVEPGAETPDAGSAADVAAQVAGTVSTPEPEVVAPADEAPVAPPRARRTRGKAARALPADAVPAEEPTADASAGTVASGSPSLPDLSEVTAYLDAAQAAGTDGPGDDESSDDEDSADRPRRSGRSRRRRGGRGRGAGTGDSAESADSADDGDEAGADDAGQDEDSQDETAVDAADDAQERPEGSRSSRRRRRGGRSGAAAGADEAGDEDDDTDRADQGAADGSAEGDDDTDADPEDESDDGGDDDTAGSRSSRRRRRRRRRSGGGDADLTADPDDPPGTIVRIRESRADEVTKVKGSTRLEAKRQRRRDGRGTARKRTVITEAEFLTRRESVDRTLLVREGEDRTEIAVLEDGVLVEHHVTRASQQSMIGNVYLGKVQNVLPSMEAAFVDIGRGRNAVLYAGEVNWDAVGLTNGAQRKIEDALKPGDPVLAQVSKDPIGHKGARLTAQISLPGRYLVYVPGSSMTGISRKLPETERTRLKKVLRRVVPEDAGVIVRTAAEGASETELERDVARLQAQWEDIERKSKAVQAPARLYSEPDLAIKVVRDVFNEDFTRLVVSGDETWETLDGYVRHVAPDLAERMSRWVPEDGAEQDLFVHHRIDEQIAKALDRKVWLPSGGSLVIDRTEAMTVVDVNTGKYTGNGGNLEETVTRNNLEAAEEIVRQLRLRDIGGIIVVDFIDMVLESNRNLVLRRLVECLGRDRTKHQVAEVTSLGLVQLTRKRVGSGLLESFSTPCEHCQGRGLVTHSEPIGAGNELPGGPGDTGNRGPGGAGGGSRRRGGGRSNG